MLIDWFTIIAQLINFLVLVWLLKHFLYRPILNTIDAREKRIADELADADSKRAEADQQREEFQQKNTEFDQQRTAKMNIVGEEAKTERARLLESVRQESDALRSKLELALKNEQLSLKDSLSQRAREEVFAIVRKALSDMAGTSLEASIADVFVKRLDALADAEKANLQAAFQDSTEALIVHTAFDLPKKQITQITKALHGLLGDGVVIEFATDANLISGIEIDSHGQKIGWSIADYLTTLTKRVNDVMLSHNAVQYESPELEKSQEQAS
ncbi:F0F1 ATP synthase subunit B [Marinomonas sp. UCMA 3892]|uniref:F0F1 ATP synthase subunit B family protein n=1 Tax=unclassified Marinomonas TaxID=196814 RepID=UPI001469BA63|nr:F0F1 ATP synthase subunit delta [Marinomonas sp. UCMA 3892]NLU99733.1 F0F1 ATP synthase subunit B [Marinomonas sp. UCMA 3892]